MKTWNDIAFERGVKVEPDGSITGQAYADVGISILNGCPDCGTCVAPYNSYQIAEDDPYTYCRDCADDSPYEPFWHDPAYASE